MSVTRPLATANDLVRLLADQESGSVAELAALLGVPRTSLLRLIDGLKSVGLVEAMPDGRVHLSLRWLRLADVVRASRTEWSGAQAVLDLAAERTRQTAYLTVPWENSALCIEWAPGSGIDLLVLKPGRALPLHAGAAGRVILAFSASPLTDLLDLSALTRLTPVTLTESAALREDATLTRERGYALSVEDVTIGIGAIGVPIRTAGGGLRGCLSVGGLVEDVLANESLIAEELTRLARRL